MLATFVNFLLADTSGGLGLGEPWDSLFKAAGATLLIVLAALWRKLLYLPGVVEDLRTQLREEKEERAAEVAQIRSDYGDRISELTKDRDRLLGENREMTQWLQQEAIPLVSRSTAVIERFTATTAESSSPTRKAKAK